MKAKTSKVEFPEDNCGACGRCRPSDGSTGICSALPPTLCWDGEELIAARALVDFSDQACIYFTPRIQA